MPLTATRGLVRQTERWFVRHGVPNLIANYSFVRHILPRMLPFLAFVAVTSTVSLLPDDISAWWPLLLLVVAAAAFAALTALGRRMPRYSRTGTVAVLAAYAAMPVVVSGIAALAHDAPFLRAVGVLALIFAFVFAAAWLVTAYGLMPLSRRAVGNAVRDLGDSLQMQARTLPLLLFATLFFFFTGELWQAMNKLPWLRVLAVLGLFSAVTVLAAAGRLRDEIERVEQDLSPPRLTTACEGTPLAGVPADMSVDGSLQPVPLTARQHGNLLLMLATRQLAQAAVVGVGLFIFFVILGRVIVTDAVAEQWIGEAVQYSSTLGDVPVALLRNAAVLAGFGSMYFAVTSMSDAENRSRFFAPILDEIERVLAVRAVYLGVREVVLPEPTTGPPLAATAAAPDQPEL